MLKGSRYKDSFEFIGDSSTHLGPFEAGSEVKTFENVKASSGSCC